MDGRSGNGRAVGVLVLAIASGTGVGCGSFPTLGDVAARRATQEFSCPRDKIGILSRSDIYDGIVDVEACGQRARYFCFVGRLFTCVREPDPAHWDSDPSLCVTHDATTSKPAGCFDAPQADPAPASVRPVFDKDHLI